MSFQPLPPSKRPPSQINTHLNTSFDSNFDLSRSVPLLEALIVIAECPSLATASERLGLTQPALSMQLKKLQEQFAIPLFEFQGKRKVLTVYGRTIYTESKRLLSDFKLVFENVNRQFLEGTKLSLRIGGRRELLLKAQKSLQFDGKILFRALSSKTALQALLDRQIDIAISRLKPNSSELIAKEFFTDSPWLVTHKKWLKNLNPQKITTDKLFICKTPLIIYTESGDLMQSWLNHLNLTTAELNIKYVCEDWLSILQMVESGQGYAIIPDSIKSNLEQVIHLPLPNPIVESVTYYFIYRKSLIKIPHYQNLLRT